MINALSDKLIWYAEQIYDMEVKISYSKDKSIIFIHTLFDDFKIHLNDKERFGVYTLFHQNKRDGQGYWHVQDKCKYIEYAVYLCLVHGFNKCYDLWGTRDDYVRFTYDAKRAWKWEYGN